MDINSFLFFVPHPQAYVNLIQEYRVPKRTTPTPHLGGFLCAPLLKNPHVMLGVSGGIIGTHCFGEFGSILNSSHIFTTRPIVTFVGMSVELKLLLFIAQQRKFIRMQGNYLKSLVSLSFIQTWTRSSNFFLNKNLRFPTHEGWRM